MSFLLKIIRAVLGQVLLFLNAVFAPTPLKRSAEKQKQVDQETSGMILYQFEACPFCIKVRRALRRLNLKMELRDAAKVPTYREELLQGGGQVQVPCLRLTQPEAAPVWMYESSEIIHYLESRFANS